MSDKLTELFPTPEFSRPIVVEGVKIGKSERRIEATPEERKKLAQRFNLLSLDQLSADLRIIRKGQGDSIRISVSGYLTANVTQSCVITLEPINSDIQAEFNTVFDSDTDEQTSGVDLDPENEEIPEEIVDGIVDLGELVAQSLAIEIDPFPRKDDVDSAGMTLESADSKENPFSVLEKLKSGPK